MSSAGGKRQSLGVSAVVIGTVFGQQVAHAADSLDSDNVVWHAPSRNHNGSMPIDNGGHGREWQTNTKPGNPTSFFKGYYTGRRLPQINGKPIDLCEKYTYRSPYMENKAGSDIVTVRYGKRRWDYDFAKNSVTEVAP